jgi:CRP-like cAMP-binding protein
MQSVRRLTTPIGPIKAGKTLTRQGELGLEFFVIREGKAEVSIDGKVVATLGPGDFLGEMSLLDGKPRTATVTCITDIKAFVLSHSEFSQLMQDAPDLTRRLLVGMAERLRTSDSRLSY